MRLQASAKRVRPLHLASMSYVTQRVDHVWGTGMCDKHVCTEMSNVSA